MSFLKFLQDRSFSLVFFLVGLVLLDFILWLDPSHDFYLDTLVYLNILLLVFLALYLVLYYFYHLKWYSELKSRNQHIKTALYQPLRLARTNEQHLVEDYNNNLLLQHQRVLTQNLEQQQDQKEFIEGWVHDIKVPLAATQLLLETQEEQVDEKSYFQMEDELLKINHYVEQVLYYTRLDDFSKDYLIQEYDLKEIVYKVIASNRNYFIQKHLTLVTPENTALVLTDEKWLRFILEQILNNSIKYTPENGQIRIKIQKDHQGVWLCINDSGIGIPDEDQKRIFDKGFTGENGRKSNQHATGLGLYLARKLGEKLGHEFQIASKVNQGTTISILFPFLTYYNSGDGKQIR